MEDRSKLLLCAAAIALALAGAFTVHRVVSQWGDVGPTHIWVEAPAPDLADDDVEPETWEERTSRVTRPTPKWPKVQRDGRLTVTFGSSHVAEGRVRFVVRSSRDLAGAPTPLPPAWIHHTATFEFEEGYPVPDATGSSGWRHDTTTQYGRYRKGTWTFDLPRVEGADGHSWMVELGHEPSLSANDDFSSELPWTLFDHEGPGGTLVEYELGTEGGPSRLDASIDTALLARHVHSAPVLWGEGDDLVALPEWTDRFVAYGTTASSRNHRPGDLPSSQFMRYLDLGGLESADSSPRPLVREHLPSHPDDWNASFVAGARRAFVYDVERDPIDPLRDVVTVLPDIEHPERDLTLQLYLDGVPEGTDEIHLVGFGRVLRQGHPSTWRVVASGERVPGGGVRADFAFDRLRLVLPERLMVWCEGCEPVFLDAHRALSNSGHERVTMRPGSGGVVVGRFRRSDLAPPAGALVAPASGLRVRLVHREQLIERAVGREVEDSVRLGPLGWAEVVLDDRLFGEELPPFSAASLGPREPRMAAIGGDALRLEWTFTDAGPGVVELEVVERPGPPR